MVPLFWIFVSFMTFSFERRQLAVPLACPDDASKPDMAGRRINRLWMARRRPVAAAVIWRTEMRAAFEHLAGNLDLRLARAVALLLPPATWILRNTAGFWRIGLVFWR